MSDLTMTPPDTGHESTPVQSLRVLLADDDVATRLLIRGFLERQGHRVVEAANGEDALRAFHARPDFQLFIVDVTMPIMDGLSLCRALKETLASWVPLILISANDQENDQVQGLDIGADYYMTKPISFPLLTATVKAAQRVALLYNDLRQKNAALQRYYNKNRADNDLARQLLEKITRAGENRVVDAQYVVTPAGDFSGDMIVSVRSMAQRHYCFVADATGHGLPAAITLMPAVETFYQLAEEGYALSTIARELNDRLQKSLPRGHFLAATLIMLEPHTHRLEVWNGGSPPAYLLEPESREITAKFTARHPPLGVLAPDLFESDIESTIFHPSQTLVACTDGVVEVESPDGRMFGSRGLEQLLTDPERNEDLVEAVSDCLDRFAGSRQPLDDQTLLVLPLASLSRSSIGGVPVIREQDETDGADPVSGGWYFSLGVRGNALKEAELAPMVSKVLAEIGLSGQSADRAQVCVIELLSNAIDHGVLGLDSQMKHQPDGFEIYFQERQQRLQRLAEGGVFLRASLDRHKDKAVLRVSISDTGEGFEDMKAPADNHYPSGRGLKLVEKLSDRLRFHDGGATSEFDIVVDAVTSAPR
ncbi:ATP-binding SpoIIE family protein phosphatase [Marinobacter zhanjiangensis]|uniref:Fused response regulator/phosphatase n=1 Tax=Marinobacter zhanjiangensis TaxID=578215 RepID=A0ABQ3AMV9_9GAMM|nr:SpoIIE family protein phosphatase [Marinobacter zhanjiangensis]GGY59986.1 fused response regulator/phosphatase [Marinobacter zhanjiangensis]